MSKPKLVVIVGPTASGKTSLSIELAKRFDGEVISADSRQVYKGLDLGTGKVTHDEMQDVPHHLLDVADPRDTYTVADYVREATLVVKNICARHRLPIIVGGTFFYIDALLGKMPLPNIPPNPLLRQELEERDTEALYALLRAKDPRYAEIIDRNNPRRLVRALEIIDAVGYMPTLEVESPYDSLTLGLSLPKEKLHKNIHNRLLARLEAGMLDEVRNLHTKGVSYERMEELGLEYRYIARHLKNQIDHEIMCSEIETKSRQFAKRQMTWLNRNKEIVWVGPKDIEMIMEKVSDFLQAS